MAAACGGQPSSGPSPIADGPPPATVSAPAAPRPIPAGLDPAYVRGLVSIDAAGQPKRWEGGPMHHCFSVDPREAPAAEAAAQRMTVLSGVQRTDAGPCNVEWVTDSAPGHTYSEIHGTDTSIVYAKVFLRSANSPGQFLHEAGHVLGLALRVDPSSGNYIHSPRPDDLMNQTPKVQDFSADELAVLAWIYGR